MNDERASAGTVILTMVTVLAEVGIAVAVNALTASGSAWGFGLDDVRRHPLPWLVIFVVVVLGNLLVVRAVQRRRSERPTPTRSRRYAVGQLSLNSAIRTIGAASIPWLRESVLSRIGEAMESPGPVAFLVGLPGSGKTPLLAQAATRLSRRLPHVLAVSFDGPTAVEPGYLLSRLNGALAAFGRDIDPQVLQRTEYRRALAELTAALSDLPVLILIDRLDEADDDWQSAILHTLADMARARTLAAGSRRPPIGAPAMVVPVGALSAEETRGLAAAAVSARRLSVDVDAVLVAVPEHIAQHPQSLLFALAQADLLPAEVARHRYARAAPLAAEVDDLVRSLPSADQGLLARLAMVSGLSTSVAVGLGAFRADATLSEGAVLLRSSLVESKEPAIRIPAIVRSAVRRVAAQAVSSGAADMVSVLLGDADIQKQASVAPMIAYRLAELGEVDQRLRICRRRILLDHLNRTGRWDAYLALLRLGVEIPTPSEVVVGEGEDSDVDLLLRLARKLPQRGDLEAGQIALDRAVALVGPHGDRHVFAAIASHRGQLSLLRNDPRQAREDFEAALELAVRPAQLCVIHKQLGHVWELLGDADTAIEHYRQAADAGSPDDRHAFEARLNGGLLRLRREGTGQADIGELLRDLLEEAHKFRPRYPLGVARARLAVALWDAQTGRRRAAVRLAREVVAMDQPDPRLRFKAEDLLSRWAPTIRGRLGSARAVALGWLRRPRDHQRSAQAQVDEYLDNVRQLYQWSSGQPFAHDETVEVTRRLREDLTVVAVGTGMDHEKLQSIFDDADAWTIAIADG